MAVNIEGAKKRMQKTIGVLKDELGKIRGTRVNPELVEDLQVEVYGTKMPLNQLATISVADARLITVQVWDKNNVEVIVKAIETSDIGVTPSADGELVRLAFPPLSEERREEITKFVGQKVEEAKVAIRNIRKDLMKVIDPSTRLRQAQPRSGQGEEREEKIPEDEAKRKKDQLQKEVDSATEEIEGLGKEKEEEVMRV